MLLAERITELLLVNRALAALTMIRELVCVVRMKWLDVVPMRYCRRDRESLLVCIEVAGAIDNPSNVVGGGVWSQHNSL